MLSRVLNNTEVRIFRNDVEIATFFLDLHVTQTDEVLDVWVNDCNMTTTLASVLSVVPGALADLPWPFQARKELVQPRGQMLRYRGRRNPPRLVMRAPWGSTPHIWFEAEHDRVCDGLYTSADKFNMVFHDVEGRWSLEGCFVADIVQDGEIAHIDLRADVLDK